MKRTALFVADDPAAFGEPGEGDRGLALAEAAGEAVTEGLVHLGGDGFGAEALVGAAVPGLTANLLYTSHLWSRGRGDSPEGGLCPAWRFNAR